MKKIVFIISLFFLISCKKNEENSSIKFLKSIDKIQLYSYPSRMSWDTINYGKEKIVFKNSKLFFDRTKVVDSLELLKSIKDDVINILIDKKWENKGLQAACYEPRHLFTFYKNNKIVGYYEVCLECGGWECSKELEKLPMFCIEKGEELKELFIKMQLKNIGEEYEHKKKNTE